MEVNSTFYAIASPETVNGWVKRTPAAFTFDVKLHRLLSRHAAPLDSLPGDLRDGADTTPRGRVRLDGDLEAAMAERTLDAVRPLVDAGKMSAFLLQLSPAFGPGRHEPAELAPLVEHLAPHPVAVELRHRAWASPKRLQRTLDAVGEIGAVFVGVDAPQGESIMMMPPVDAVTRDDLAYLRAHGRNAEGYVHGRTVAERFGYDYPDAELEQLAERARDLAAQVPQVRMMFNNNRGSDAPRAARRTRELLGQDPGPEPVREAEGSAR